MFTGFTGFPVHVLAINESELNDMKVLCGALNRKVPAQG